MHARLAKYKIAKHRELALRFDRWSLKYYVSFRTFLFTFYVAVLIAAQIAKLYPALVEESIAGFLGVVEFSVIILLAFKDLGEEFPRDRNRARARLEEFEKYLAKAETEAKAEA
jgi:hypothetical protein